MILAIAAAGALGAMARFLVDSALSRRQRSTPIGTLVVNVTACFALGLMTGAVVNLADGEMVAAVVGVGFLGGYSTFSTASVEAARLLLARRGGAAVLHAGLMLVLSVLAALAGLMLTS